MLLPLISAVPPVGQKKDKELQQSSKSPFPSLRGVGTDRAEKSQTTHTCKFTNLSLSLSLSPQNLSLSLPHSLNLCPSGVKCSIAFLLFAVLVRVCGLGRKQVLFFLLVSTTSIWKCQITNARTVPLWMIR